MEQQGRKSDGRRVYAPQFKREQLTRVERGELTLAELSRELGISRSLLQRWKALAEQATETAVGTNEDVVRRARCGRRMRGSGNSRGRWVGSPSR